MLEMVFTNQEICLLLSLQQAWRPNLRLHAAAAAAAIAAIIQVSFQNFTDILQTFASVLNTYPVRTRPQAACTCPKRYQRVGH